MSAKARRTLASSRCEKELKLVLDSTRDSSAIFQGKFALRYEAERKQRRRFPTQTLFSITSLLELWVTEMYPYTQLYLSKKRSVAVTGPHFSVLGSEYVSLNSFSQRILAHIKLEFRTGELEGSTANFDEQNVADLLKSGPIHFSAVDTEFEHLVTVGEDKKLKVWELDGPKLRSQRFALALAFV